MRCAVCRSTTAPAITARCTTTPGYAATPRTCGRHEHANVSARSTPRRTRRMPKSIDNQDLICNIRTVLLVVVARLVEIDLAVNLSQSRFHSDGGRGSRGAAFFSLFPADAGGVSSTPWGWLLPSTPGQFIAHVCRQLIDPGLLAPLFRQDMAELDHVGVSEIVQIHPNHRFGNVQHPHEEISNSDQDVVLGGAGPLGANVTVDEHAVMGRGLQAYEMLV